MLGGFWVSVKSALLAPSDIYDQASASPVRTLRGPVELVNSPPSTCSLRSLRADSFQVKNTSKQSPAIERILWPPIFD